MAIEFHCEHCGKMVRASDEHAGRHAKCPSCHQPVYIPTPDAEIEPLRLAPLDPTDERERARLLKEEQDLRHRLLREREAGYDTGPPKSDAAREVLPPKLDMETLVIEYALSMADGNLADAQELANDIRKDMRKAEDVLQKLMADTMPPPQLAKIPRPVLVGFFKQLREHKK